MSRKSQVVARGHNPLSLLAAGLRRRGARETLPLLQAAGNAAWDTAMKRILRIAFYIFLALSAAEQIYELCQKDVPLTNAVRWGA